MYNASAFAKLICIKSIIENCNKILDEVLKDENFLEDKGEKKERRDKELIEIESLAGNLLFRSRHFREWEGKSNDNN